MTASPREGTVDPSLWVRKYEGGVLCTLLPLDVVQSLYQVYCLREETGEMPELARLASGMISGIELDQERARNLLQARVPDSYAFEIYKNLRYAPQDKIALEYGKCLVASGNYDGGEQVLLRVTRRINEDWRVVYRSFCVIAWSARARGDVISAARYEELCRIANPQYPEMLLLGGVGVLGKCNDE
jgi:hypothetical protein